MKFWYNPNFLALFFLIIFSLFALKDLAKSNFYSSHDGETHAARIAQYYQALSDGHIPPRWAKTLRGGLGSPIFVYIYPAPYLLGSAIHSIGFSFTDSLEILIALSFIFSAIFTYMWLKEIWHYPSAAFAGALFYTWVPYKFSLIFVRGSLSESLAYTFLPFTLWTITKLASKMNFKWVAICALSISALLLSQNLVAYMATPIIGLYVLILAISKKSLRYFVYSLLASIWAFLISSITYLPALFERKFVQFDDLLRDAYSSHFVTLGQLFHSPWDYGFSLPGVNDSISFQVGLGHILVIGVSIVLLILYIFNKLLAFSNLYNFFFEKVNKLQLTLTLFFTAILALSIFLMLDTTPSKATWDFIEPLQLIDIPWRLLGITALTTAFLTSFAVRSINNRLFFLFVIIAVLVANRNHLRINEQHYLDDIYLLNYQGSATQFNEFAPKSRSEAKVTEEFPERIEIIKGDIDIINVVQETHRLSFKTRSNESVRLQINIVKFPGWKIFMDGQEFISDASLVDKSYKFEYRKDRDERGLYDIIVPKGQHEFTVKYTETPLRTLANYLSLSFLLLAVVTIGIHAKK